MTEADKDKILNFVKNGGGLVLGICPWGWAQIKKTNDFSKMLTYKTLLQSEMALTLDGIWGNFDFDLTKSNLELSHFGFHVGNILFPQKENFDYSTSHSLMTQIKSLPDSEKIKVETLGKCFILSNEIQSISPSKLNPINRIFQEMSTNLILNLNWSRKSSLLLSPDSKNFITRVIMQWQDN